MLIFRDLAEVYIFLVINDPALGDLCGAAFPFHRDAGPLRMGAGLVACAPGGAAIVRDRLFDLGTECELPDMRPEALCASRPFEELEGAPRAGAGLHFAAVFSDSHFPLVPLHALRHTGSFERVNHGV